MLAVRNTALFRRPRRLCFPKERLILPLRMSRVTLAVAFFPRAEFQSTEVLLQRLANQQLESALGGFELVAFVLQLLDALEELAAGVLFEAVGEAVLLELKDNIAAA